MDAFESRLESVAKSGIEGLIADKTRAIVNGSARSIEQHRYDIGYLQGLSEALEAIDQARTLMLSGERASAREAI
jgi:hypothetical protein